MYIESVLKLLLKRYSVYYFVSTYDKTLRNIMYCKIFKNNNGDVTKIQNLSNYSNSNNFTKMLLFYVTQACM